MAIESERLLTVREVAARLRVHPITVRRLIASGRLAAVRIGRVVRVRESDVHRVASPQRLARERHLREMTSEEWERTRQAASKLIELRNSMPPLGISTTKLVREGRRQLEERDERRARGRR